MVDPYAFLKKNVFLYDKILLFPEADLQMQFCRIMEKKMVKKPILVLAAWPMKPAGKNITFHQLTPEEARQLVTLYYTYEFSDNFLLLSQDSAAFPSLYNFVRTGVLSMEEFFEALLC